MKKNIFLFGLLIVAFSLVPTQKLTAQAELSPWENGPRWSSVQVPAALNQWVVDYGIWPDAIGEWVMYDYTDFDRGVWTIVISWGIGGLGGEELGTATLRIKSNGTIIDEIIN